jgi:hypothetical protein
MPFPIYDKKDAIPAGAEDVYEERDGKWHPKAAEDTSGLTSALAKERDARKAAEKAAKAATDERDTAVRERDVLKTQTGDSDGKVAELLKRWDTEKTALEEKYKGDLKTRDDRIRTLTLDQTAKAAFVKAGGRPEKADAALKLYADRLDLAEDRPVVKDDKGQVTTDSLDKFFGEVVRKELPEFYTGTKAAGGGAGGINGGVQGSGTLTGEQILQNPGAAFDAANASATA